tara:strand:- start:280 stop:450 length:171 start_codon:yes stop_codon:yes gene_type:complete
VITEIFDYLRMGGYGWFVWPSYLIVGAALIGIWLQSKKSLKRRQEQISALQTKFKD